MIVPVFRFSALHPGGEPRDADANDRQRSFWGLDESRDEPPRCRNIQIDPDTADGPSAGDHNLSLSFTQVSDSRRASIRVLEIGSQVTYPAFREDRDVGRDGAKMVDRHPPVG